MAYEDELLITYGLGYAFEKSKLLIVSEIEEKTILKKELDIMEEINAINKFKEELDAKCDLKFPRMYLSNVEEALEEKLSKIIPIITSIKAKSANGQDNLMDEYIKRDLSQMRLRKEGYIQKDSTLIKEYLDNCDRTSETNIESKEHKSLKYNKVILKIILTTNYGNDFSRFLTKQGQAGIIDNTTEKYLENILKNDYLVKKKYSELDFLNFLLFLEEWESKYFCWNEKYTSLMYSINKDGRKYKGSKSEIKDYVISFLKQKKYLYVPFGRYNEDNIFITLNDERYCNKIAAKTSGEDTKNNHKYVLLEKKESNLYQITSNDYDEIDLDYNTELGYLLSYESDNVYISLVKYNKVNEKVSIADKYDKFKPQMLKALEAHFIL